MLTVILLTATLSAEQMTGADEFFRKCGQTAAIAEYAGDAQPGLENSMLIGAEKLGADADQLPFLRGAFRAGYQDRMKAMGHNAMSDKLEMRQLAANLVWPRWRETLAICRKLY